MTDIDIKNLGYGLVSRGDLEKYFANDSRLDRILSIFEKINSLDGKNENTLSREDLYEMQSLKYGYDKFGAKYASLNSLHDDKITDFELEQYFEEAIEFYGDGIEKEDFIKFLKFVSNKGDEIYKQKLEEASKELGMSIELIEKLGGANNAKEYKLIFKDGKKFYERSLEDFTEIRDENGKLLEHRFQNCGEIGYENCEEIVTYTENGENSKTYINHQTGEQTRFQYGSTLEEKIYKMHLKDGVAVKHSFDNSENAWNEMKLEEIVFRNGIADSTKVSFKYDENNKLTGVDVVDENPENNIPRGFSTDGETFFTHIPTKVEQSVVESLKQMIDGGARYGEDFELKVENGQLKIVPKIINNTEQKVPELKGKAFDKYKELVSKGIHSTEDFEVEYDSNGNFKYKYKNNQAKDFACEFKSEIYDKNGNLISSLMVKNGEIIKEEIVNGEKQSFTMSFEDGILQLIIEQKFEIVGDMLGKDDILTGGYNIYSVAEKYKQVTGRELVGDVYDVLNVGDNKNINSLKNLMQKLQPHGTIYSGTKESIIENYYKGYNEFKEILSFNPYSSPIAHLLPKRELSEISDTSYTERVGNDTFNIDFHNNKINVIKNGKEVGSINVSELPENYVKNLLLNLPATVLQDLSAKNIKLILNDRMSDNIRTKNVNGYYSPKDGGTIVLDPNALIGERAIKTIVHESGHMHDHIDDRENAIRVIKERMKDPTINFGRDKAVTVKELLETWGTLHPVSVQDEKLNLLFSEEYENFRKAAPHINLNVNATYALDSIEEFFAEAYTLLNLGSCKSEYVIANYFPKSLARVKEIIENNRKL